MVTVPQADLPKDQKIMSTVYRYNGNRVGVYVEVLRGGEVRRGDRLVLVQSGLRKVNSRSDKQAAFCCC